MLLLPRLAPLLADSVREEVDASLPDMVAAGTITAKERQRAEQALATPTNPERRQRSTETGNVYVDRILAARRHLRTGVLQVLTFGAIEGRTDYHGWRPTFVTDTANSQPWVQTVAEANLGPDHPYWELNDARQRKAQTHGFWLTKIEVGTVGPLSAATWKAIEDRVQRAQVDKERQLATGQRRPLGGLSWKADAGRYRIGHGGERQTYRVSGPGGTHLHTVNATHAAKALGELLLGVVERVDTAPLPLLKQAADSPETRSGVIRKRVHELEAELTEVEGQISGLLRDRGLSVPESREHRLATEQINTLSTRADNVERVKLPALRAELERSQTEAAAPTLEETTADFAHLTVTALALLRCDPLGPPEVHNAVSWLLDHGRGLSNLRTGEHDRQILLDVRVRIPLVEGPSAGWTPELST